MDNPGVSLNRIGGAVRLTMSAHVANDLGALQKGLKSLAERLGHSSCATGCDILHLAMERDFFLDKEGVLNPHAISPALGLAQDPMPIRSLSVAIPAKVNNDINALSKAVGVVLGKLGCGACCSGFDILFRREMRLLALDERINVQEFGNLG